ncbi:hypothetical protein ACFE04_012064 [Oxalis oulophora]
METNYMMKSDSHVAQQSRRERLRIHQHNFQELNNNDHLDWSSGINYPLDHYPERNVSRTTSFAYDPSIISHHDMINFLTNPERAESSPFIAAATHHDHSQQHSNDWMSSYVTGGGIRIPNNAMNISEVVPSNARISDNDRFIHQVMKPTGCSSWGNHDYSGGGVLPDFGNHSTRFNFDGASIENLGQRHLDMANMARKSDELSRKVSIADPNSQGLSLSLSKTHFRGAYASPESSPNFLSAIPIKPSIISRSSGKSLDEIMAGTNCNYQGTGPLGPFTGYATILKNSKFLMPAQELLHECCNSKHVNTFNASERRDYSGELVCSPGANNLKVVAKVDEVSVMSSSTYHSSNDIAGDCAIGCSNAETYRLDYHQTKAKLICLQEEVCRKYKQYHQQMQMVVSSFESVSGLRAATPYVSLAIKSVSRNFRGLKIAILDQLKHIGKALGEDLLSPTTGASSSDGNLSRHSKYANKSGSFNQKQKSSGGNHVGFIEPQCVWRSQRGLPERSVAVLRAWLFEHFLHPYPTDTDKHMLAAQTGLTRNQVSNWFINARVRIWKPMVEEMHTLENSRETGAMPHNGKSPAEGTSRNSGDDKDTNKLNMNTISEKQFEFSEMGSSGGIRGNLGVENWNRGKHALMGDCQVMDESLMGLVPYQRSGIGIGGLGAVSLTLELRHGVENIQQQQQQMLQHQDQLRNQFGVHHFVG